ncbi:hypothetical protein M885DRAFT_533807 [Pelagophyceae sp. CCMP2097]|nr:hypothetical protein M885DRAFT_533807 [Pelagophyceae sp. CCMP2097]|mmetsp:Transcript_26668/g.89742  ORF Transcript_26668/g.89742 Transcript_26668/m.89742 type:complete len:152 (-) Transcript_26668:74-529(-)
MVARIASRADDRSNANALMITRVERDGVELVGAVKRSAAQRLDSDVGDLRVAVEAVETRGLSRLSTALERMHSEGAIAVLRQRALALEDAETEHRNKLDLALRFIDWFSTRGEAYEHNLHAMDRRLGGMVLADRDKMPPAREPYKANLNFT